MTDRRKRKPLGPPGVPREIWPEVVGGDCRIDLRPFSGPPATFRQFVRGSGAERSKEAPPPAATFRTDGRLFASGSMCPVRHGVESVPSVRFS